MRKLTAVATITALSCLTACATKGKHPEDPYESINRKTHAFNQAYDAAILKPVATVYATLLPAPVRSGINNLYDNVNMIPTVANDLLQGELTYAYKDTWRLIINSTVGIVGLVDVAKTMSLPPRSNDLGITFAKWGNKQSPYIVIPFLGPSTIRDGMGMMFNYTLLTPYPYLSAPLAWSLVGVRYVDLRSQMFDTDKLMAESLDKYTFIRDAYLQHRHYLITGEQAKDTDNGALYVPEDDHNTNKVLPEEPANGKKSDFPLTTAQHVTHRTVSA